MAEESAAWTWNDVVARLRDEPLDTVVQIAASAIEEPKSVGLHPMPAGADGRPVFGRVLDEQTGLLVQVSGENYEARLCRLPQQAAPLPPAPPPVLRQSVAISPTVASAAPQRAAPSPPSQVPVLVESRAELVVHRAPFSWVNLPAERPGTTMLATTLFGALLGAAIGGKEGAWTGALIAGGAGLASIAVSTAATSPATSQAAQTLFLALASASLGGKGGGPVLRLGPGRQPALPPPLGDGSPSRTRRLPRNT